MKKICVIGGGLQGLATAYTLRERGHEVTLLERREGVALETSYANGGMLTPSMPDPWNAPGVHWQLLKSFGDPHSAMKLRLHAVPSLVFWGLRFMANSTPSRHAAATKASYVLATYGTKELGKLREALGLEYEAAAEGALKVFRTRDAMAGSLEVARSLKPLGMEFEELDADGVIAREPQLEGIRDQIAGGIYYPGDETGDAHIFCNALADRLIEMGVDIRLGTEVTQLNRTSGAVTGVSIGSDTLDADCTILATGYFCVDLLKGVGINLPVRPAKGYSVTFNTKGHNAVPKVPVVDDALHAAVTPLGDRLRVVGTAEFTGRDTSLSQERIDNLAGLLNKLYPHLADSLDAGAAEPWAGLRPMSADGLPFVGATRLEGLYVNTGHGHLGWTMAVGSGLLLADLLEGKPTAIDPEPYRATRI